MRQHFGHMDSKMQLSALLQCATCYSLQDGGAKVVLQEIDALTIAW